MIKNNSNPSSRNAKKIFKNLSLFTFNRRGGGLIKVQKFLAFFLFFYSDGSPHLASASYWYSTNSYNGNHVIHFSSELRCISMAIHDFFKTI